MSEEKMMSQDIEIPVEKEKKVKKAHPHFKNRVTAVLGALILVFSIIGFVGTMVTASGWVVSLVQNQKQKDEYAEYIYPLVMLDMPAFEGSESLQPTSVLKCGIWNFILNADTSKYETDDLGVLVVPQTDIEVYATALFGEGLVFEHQSVGDAESAFSYDSENGMYEIVGSALFTYYPRVTEISHKDGKTHLRVEYIVPEVYFGEDDEKNAKASKVMEYILDESSGSRKIVGIETILSGNSLVDQENSSSVE